MKTTRRMLITAAAAAIAMPSVARANAWPSKPIRLIATFPPGGLADTICRVMAPKFGELLGQQVIVDNRPGAGGTLGADMAAKAPPDGHTLVMSHASPHGVAPGIYPKMPYDPVADFSHLTLIGDAPNIFMVPPDSPYKSLADFVAAVKAKPGEIAFGSSGVGSTTHLMGENFGQLIGAKLRHIPYRGSAPSLADMWAGIIPSMFDPITTNVGHMRVGKIKVLAISTAKRIAPFPDVPTFAEQGFPRMTTSTWVGLSGPKGMPADVQSRLYDATLKIVAMPDVRARFDELALFLPDKPMGPKEFSAYITEFVDIWTKVSKAANVQVE